MMEFPKRPDKVPRWVFGLWFVLVVGIFLLIVAVNEFFDIINLDDKMAIGDFMNDIMVFLASTSIAIGGVTITGFIFFIESIRRLVDTDQIYADTVEDMRTHLLHAVIATFTMCVIFAITCGACMVTVFDDNAGDHGVAVTSGTLLFVYGILLLENLYLDYRVMGYKTYLRRFAGENKIHMQGELNGEGYNTMHVLSEESSALRRSNILTTAGPDLMGHTYCTYYEKPKDKKDNPTEKHDCVEISDRYSIWDAMKLYDDTERILKRIAGLDNESFASDDYKRLETALGAKQYLAAGTGMADDIMDGYKDLKKYHDSMIVADDGTENSSITVENLKPMLPRLSLLRFELVRKLSEKDLSGLTLHGYDFSNGVMRNTILTGGKLIDSTFIRTELDCANMTGCDLSMADMRNAHAESAVFDKAKMVRTNMSNTRMSGSSFAGAILRRATINGSDMTGIVMTDAEILSTNIRDSDFSGADMRSTNCVDVEADDVRFANSIFDGSRIDDGTFRGCDFTGTNFGDSAINNMYFQDLTLNAVRFENADIMETIFVGCSMYDSFCSDVNFTGSVLMGVNLSEARISNCDFNKAMICPYRPGEDGANTAAPLFTHATMSGNTYTDSEIIGAVFDYANMTNTRASNTKFRQCDFTKADLTGSRFLDCEFTDCKLPAGFEGYIMKPGED